MNMRRPMKALSAVMAIVMILLTLPLGTVHVHAETEHTHSYGACIPYSDTLHVRACACGDQEYAHHNWDAGVSGLVPENGSGESSNWGDLTFNPTPDFSGASGTVTYTCLDCGTKYVGSVSSLPTHTYTEYEPLNATQHKHACLCGEYVAENHTWDSGKVTVAATHTTTGTKLYTCTLCGETKTETVAKTTTHEWDAGVITTPATCTTAGVKTYTCPCGETKTETIPIGGHSYGSWTQHDATNHKKTCSVCGEIAYEGHVWNSGTQTSAPTHLKEGSMLYTCTTCNETKTVSVPKLADHEWDNGTVTTPATCTATGIKTYTCPCGDTKTEILPSLGHSYGDWEQDDKTNHKKTCSVCGEIEYEGHAWDEGETVIAPTHSSEGELLYTCSTCGETKTETLEKVPHDYSSWEKYNDDLHTRTCGCGVVEYAHHAWAETAREGMYIAGENGMGAGLTVSWEDLFASQEAIADKLYTCTVCGTAHDGTPDALPTHTYESYEKLDGENHSIVCKCGESITEAHEWDGGVVTKPATPFETGILTYTCEHCGETKTEEIPLVKVPGDINGDGNVNVVDLAFLRRHLAGWTEYLDINEDAADVNKDGSITITDLALIRRYLAGWEGIVLQ